jgi:hypothetical protein
MATYISAASLLISVLALGVSVVVIIRNARLASTQIKTELLSKLNHVRIEYTRFNRRIRKLRENPPQPLPPELKALLDAEAEFQKFEQYTEVYRQALLEPRRKFTSELLLSMQHSVDAIAQQTADDNTRLDELLASIEQSP